jgi:hypothetical protein
LHMYGNLVLSCRPCNANKHSHSLNDFLEKVSRIRCQSSEEEARRPSHKIWGRS